MEVTTKISYILSSPLTFYMLYNYISVTGCAYYSVLVNNIRL
jgi:hypothetical protein